MSATHKLVNGRLVPLTAAEATAIEAEWAANLPQPPRRPRLFRDVRADLQALSGPQKAAVWAAFTAGSPPLYQTDRGPHGAALALVQFLGETTAFATAEQTEFQLRAVALYLLDNPGWLVKPAFDPTINIAGDELEI